MTTNNHPESFKGVTEADDDDDDDSHSSEESNGDDSEELEGEVPLERDSDVMELEMEINMNEDFADEESVLNQLSSVSFGGDVHVCEGWNRYKLVGDNVDKNVHPSFQRGESATRSLHYFHTYAVFDRINLSGVSDNPSSKPIQLQKLLPSLSDISCLTLSWTAHSQSGLHVLSQHHICPRISRPVPSSGTKLGHPWQHR